MAAADEIWRVDPVTLQEVVLEPQTLLDRLESSPALERVWILQILGRLDEAAAEGEALLVAAANRFRPLLALAQVYQRQYRWQAAARLQEEALCLARTRVQEATVRHEVGNRLFAEGKYRDAAAEFEWAMDLRRSSSRSTGLIEASHHAMERARERAANSLR